MIKRKPIYFKVLDIDGLTIEDHVNYCNENVPPGSPYYFIHAIVVNSNGRRVATVVKEERVF